MIQPRSSAALAALVLSFPVASQEAAPPDAAPGQAEAAPAVPTTMLRLRSGDVLWGAIEAHDPDAVEFRRLDTGGLLRLPWGFLDPDEERGLRLRFGYVDAQSEEILVEAERILLDDGTEIVGRIVNRTDEHLWIKHAQGTLPIHKRRLVGASTAVQVPALDVYTREELYQQKALELQAQLVLPGTEGAQAHDELARFAERLHDYPHAQEHYRTAQTLDPGLDTARISAALERAELKAELQEQADLLADIDLMRARKRYDRALELLQTFPELYPDSPLLEDWNEMRERVARYQERDVREELVRSWYAWSVRLAREAARRSESFEEALGYVDETMADELAERVREDLQRLAPGIEAEEVVRLWSEREGGRYRQASYGMGTWLLGEDRALATLEPVEDEAEAPAEGSQAAARKALEERIQRYLKNQDLARRASAGGTSFGEEEPDVFWGRWNHSGRYQWLLAHFIESSGHFRLERIRFSNCRECGGRGVREVLFTGSAASGAASTEQLHPCHTCHTIGRVRRVRYR